MQEVEKIWLNGKLIPWKEAKTHILTHTLHYGGGVFEGIRAYKTEKGAAVFRLKEHIDRLFYSASVLEMEIPFNKEEVIEAVLETIRENNLDECYIRPLVFYGYGKMGLNPKGAPVNVCIAVWPWGKYLSKEVVAVKISKYIRIHPKSTVSDAKICGHYSNSILASLEAKKEGFDEALFLDYKGNVAEGPGENIFIVKEGKLITPKKDNILAGITRDSVIEIAKGLNIEVEEKDISVQELKGASEAFFSGTAIEICAIGKIDETEFKVGKITKKIETVFENAVKGKEYQKWLIYVRKV